MACEIGQDIEMAAAILADGGLVGIPTETVYGLAANVFDKQAVLNIFRAKQRPVFDPLITHIKSATELPALTTKIPSFASTLINAFWPGPLTLILPKSNKIDNIITSGLSTAGFRMPKHEITHKLLELVPFPLVAPSANPFGYISPTTAGHVAEQLGDKIDYILDGGVCKIGVESTIIDFSQEIPVILRSGGITKEEIHKQIGSVKYSISDTEYIKSPGMSKTHYAPTIPLKFGNLVDLKKSNQNTKFGVLSFCGEPTNSVNFVLSESGSLEEAAKRLFIGLRWLETQSVDLILAEQVPDVGIGYAINDRLRRASFE